MAQVINDPNRNRLQGISSGISQGLNAVLGAKVENLRRQPVVQELQSLGIDPQSAQFISRLEPKNQLLALQQYGYGGRQPMGQQQMQPQQYQQQPPANPYQTQAYAQEQQQKAYRSPLVGAQKPNPALIKHEDALVGQRQNLEDLIATTERMKQTLSKGGVSSGVIAGTLGHLAPSWLGTDSEQFDKDAAHVVNLTSENIKGVPSRFRVALIEKEKPGLKHSAQVNNQILDRLSRDAKARLSTLDRRYPELAQFDQQSFPQGLPQQEEQQFPQQEQYPEESPLAKTARFGVRTAARAGEAIAGTPGDIGATVLGIGNWATNGAIPSYGQVKEALPFLPPTSDDIKQFLGEATGGYTNPRGGVEETIDNIAGTAASLFLPLKLKVPFVKNLEKVLSPKTAKTIGNVILPFSGVPLKKALGLATLGEGVGLATQAVGGGPLAQAGAKLSALSLASTGTPKQLLTKRMQDSYQAMKKSVAGKISPKNTVPVQPLLKDLNSFKRKLKISGSPHAEQLTAIANKVEEGLKTARQGTRSVGLGSRVRVDDLVNQKKSINDYFKLPFNPRVAGEEAISGTARSYLGELGNIIDKPLAKYGKINTEFGINRAIATDIFKGLAEPAKVADFIKGLGSNFSSSLTSFVTKALFKQGLMTAGDKVLALQQLFSKSPQSVNYYWEALKAAGQENLPVFIRAASKLDKEAMRVFGR